MFAEDLPETRDRTSWGDTSEHSASGVDRASP